MSPQISHTNQLKPYGNKDKQEPPFWHGELIQESKVSQLIPI